MDGERPTPGREDRHAGRHAIRARFPDAQEVFLLDDFNNWSTSATRLQPVGDDQWEVLLPSQTSIHHPCFFVWNRGQRFGHIAAPSDQFEDVTIDVS